MVTGPKRLLRAVAAVSLVGGVSLAGVATFGAGTASAATLAVSDCSGSGSDTGSLPYTVAHASAGDVVTFAVSCPVGSPIVLTTHSPSRPTSRSTAWGRRRRW